VWLTIAATFIFTLRSRESAMTPDGEKTTPRPPEEEGNRNVENAVLLGFFAVLVGAGVWLLSTMADVRKVQDCAAQGRRNCVEIEAPDRAR
jgi:hypothetical protein